MKYIDKDKVESAAQGRWHEIYAQLARDVLSDNPLKHRPCPVHGGTDGFRLYNDFLNSGGGCCNTCGYFKSGFSLLMWVNNWTFKETLESLAEVLGVEGGQGHLPKRAAYVPPEPSAEEVQRKKESLKRVWEASMPINHKDSEPVRLYLLRRRLDFVGLPRSIRCNPKLSYFSEKNKQKVGDFPAMVSAIVDKDGKPLSVHRTYLCSDGHKAVVESPKKVMSPMPGVSILGGSVWLHEECTTATTVAVTEGIETGIAVQLAMGIPTFSAISSVGLANWVPPRHVKKVLIMGDKDKTTQTPRGPRQPGQEAAEGLAERLKEQGIKARIVLPRQDVPNGRKSIDWADVYARFGSSEFPRLRDRGVN